MAQRGRKRKKEALMVINPVERVQVSMVTAPVDHLEKLAWYRNKLSDDEKEIVRSEGRQLGQAMVTAFRSRLAIGQHLAKLQATLEPYGVFVKFLKNFNFNQSTAYRLIAGYKNAASILSPSIIEAAAARGMPLLGDSEQNPLGVYTKAVKRLPPPRSDDPKIVNSYLNEIEAKRKQLKSEGKTVEIEAVGPSEPLDPEDAAKEVYRVFKNRYQALPNAKTKRNFLNFVIGLEMSEAGLDDEASFEPAAIPDEFRQGRGRPRELKEETIH